MTGECTETCRQGRDCTCRPLQPLSDWAHYRALLVCTLGILALSGVGIWALLPEGVLSGWVWP